MSRLTSLIPAACLLALLTRAPWISGQSDAVILQLKLAPGETVAHAVTGNAILTYQNSAGVRQTVEGRFEFRESVRVLDVAALGATWIEAVDEDYRSTEHGGRTQETLQPAVSFRVDPDGKVVERFADPAERPDFPLPLPGKSVRVGETWTRGATSTSGELVVKGIGTYTLAGLGSSPEGRIARVTYANEGRASRGETVLGLSSESRALTKVTGEVQWLIDRGRWGRYVQEFTVVSDTQVIAPGVFGQAPTDLESRGAW